MKALKTTLTILLVLALCLAPALALAQDEAGPSTLRQVWDTVWRILNFAILAFVIVKYARKPLMKFLKGHGQDVSERLAKNRALLEQAKIEYAETEERLNEIQP